MGYYANAALERPYQERSCCGYPSREETLAYYLEESAGDALPPL